MNKSMNKTIRLIFGILFTFILITIPSRFSYAENQINHETYINIDVEKKWEENVPEDKTVKVELYADGEKFPADPIVLNKDNMWKSSFTNLPEYNGDRKIQYDVREEKVEGYISKVEKNPVAYSKDYWVMIKAPQEMEFNKEYLLAVQNWNEGSKDTYYLLSDNGDENILGLKPFSASKALKSVDNFGLVKPLEFGNSEYDEYFDFDNTDYSEENKELMWIYGGTEVFKTLQNSQSNNYITLKGENKNPITYSFIASKKDGWFQEENYGYGVNYTRNLNLSSGADNIMAKIGSVQQWGNPSVFHIFQYLNLPDGQNIGVTEYSEHAGNFKVFKKIKQISYNFTITNSVEKKIDISVNKEWIGKKLDSIKVKLYADEKDTGKVITLDDSNNWKGVFEGVLQFNPDGSEIKYTVKEVEVENYDTKVTGDSKVGFVVTNTIKQEKIEVNGQKTWEDNSNQYGKRPKNIIINLLKNGVKIQEKKVTEVDGWKWKFDNLDKYENGQEIKYTITEEKVENYKTKVEGYNVINSYIPKINIKPENIEIKVTKVWKDNDNQDKSRPEKVIVVLVKNGVDTEIKLELTKENNWTGKFENLDKNYNGKNIKYTVREIEIGNGYTSAVTGTQEEGYTITNTKNPNTPEKPKVSTKPNNPIRSNNPKTGDVFDVMMYGGVILVSGILLIFILNKRKSI